MNQKLKCPGCLSTIHDHQVINDLIICKCGWTYSAKDTHSKKQNDRTLLAIFLGFGFFLMIAFHHASHWGAFSKDVLPLKWKHITGQAKSQDLKKMYKMCVAIRNFNCQEQLLTELNQKYNDIEALKSLGHLYFSNQMYQAAEASLGSYFKEGGSHKLARYDLARTLGKLGKPELSKVQFNKILKEKPNSLQITVTRAYVHMLLENKKFSEVKSVISFYRKKSSGAEHFLRSEFKQADLHMNRALASVRGI